MLPTLREMLDQGLLTPDEATEAQAYATSDPMEWLTMPAPLMDKVWAAWHLLDFDPQAPGTPMH